MKRISIFILSLLFLTNCSSVERIHSPFDNSTFIKLDLDWGDFYLMFGNIKIVKIIFSKEFKDGNVSMPKLFCKFEGRNGEFLEGDVIELNIDGVIYKLFLVFRFIESEKFLG